MTNKFLKNAPIGRQGTNFALTEKQFHAFESLATVSGQQRFWLYAPGEGAEYWDECQAKSIMVIGYDELEDFNQYKSQSEVEQKIKKLWKSKNRPSNHSLAVWEFAKTVQPGDIVISKLGRREYLGYGIVQGPYERDDSRPSYKSFRRVSWVKTGTWTADYKLALKTLTDITKYPDYVEKLKKLIGITLNSQQQFHPEPSFPGRNIILYGPPGTGKTYELRSKYMDKFTDRQSVLSNEERAAALVKDLSWWEVVALALLDTKEKRASVAQILAHSLVEARIKLSSNNNPRAMIWAALQIHTKEECQNVKYTSRSQPLIFEKDSESVWSIDAGLVETIMPGLKITLNEYHHPADDGKIEQKRFEFVTFHQSFSYEDFIEGIKPEITETESAATSGQINYRVEPGIFKKMCRQALANPGKNFAILIDEINRGNVASIFGELITLIEEDKRLKETNELTTKLPYSREEFGVPNNLYIIGTMNTADRSVEALDTALRRRFTFIEMRPNPEKVTQPDSLKVDLRKIFEVINARIERLHDADHCIGHAYFMGVKDLAGLRSVFANKIIPLLREYFYGNPAKVGMVLGERFVKRKNDNAPFATGSWGFDDLDEKDVFMFTDPSDFSEEDFQTIYAKNGTGI